MEDFNIQQGSCEAEIGGTKQVAKSTNTEVDVKDRLSKLGLGELDNDSCQASAQSKAKLVELGEEFEDIFSKHSLDCGEAKGFILCIHQTDSQPFRIPYRRIPPAHYQQLRQVLSDICLMFTPN